MIQATNGSSNEHRPKNADGSLLHYIEWGEIIHHIFQTSFCMHILAATHADRSDIYCISDLINDNQMSYYVILFYFVVHGNIDHLRNIVIPRNEYRSLLCSRSLLIQRCKR